MQFEEFSKYNLGNTPIFKAEKYCPAGNLFLKMEMYNPKGSIKDRTAYYIIKDLMDAGRLKPDIKLVESSSGNLGLALGYFAREVGVNFTCLVDPTIPSDKIEELRREGIDVYIVSLDGNPDYRTARINMVRMLNEKPDWIWTNQYGNPSNIKAHYETTGPEIWTQTNGQIDYFVCSVGTGGTICGVGRYLKQQNPQIKIVAVEPQGSTLFGGEPGNYLSVGAGMRGPSEIVIKYGDVIDYFCKVADHDSLQECVNFHCKEAISVGVTTGSVLVVASYLAQKHPKQNIVIISPDSGEKYVNLYKDLSCFENTRYCLKINSYSYQKVDRLCQ